MSANHAPSVLVVDDENRIRETLIMILRGHGFYVFGAESGEEAINVCRGVSPDWLLSDVVMGALNGIEAAIRIRELCPNCQILLLSGDAMTSDLVDEARTRGHHFEILAKPVHPTEIIRRLSY